MRSRYSINDIQLSLHKMKVAKCELSIKHDKRR
jgi:hypothetical protein